MADTILGLLTSQKFLEQGDRFTNHRRQILHKYPQGNAPLTGILSLCGSQETTDTIINWYEKRWVTPQTKFRGTAPLTKTAPTDGDADAGTVADNAAVASVNTDLYIKVDSTKDIRPGYVLQSINDARVQFWVMAVVPGVADPLSKGYVKVRLIRALGAFTAADVAAGTVIRAIGQASGEGASAGGITPIGMKRPYQVTNNTQIWRTPFSFSGTALQEGLKFDATGPYKERAKEAIMEHMTLIERSVVWGKRSTISRPALTPGDEDETVRTMSGIMEFLELWDAGSTGLQINGATYAPYAFKPASTTDADDLKRIIDNTDGTLTVDKFNIWAERVARYGSGKTSDKLVLCGSGAALVFSKMLRKNTVVLASEKTRIYGLNVTTIVTPVGDYHLVTHPLFNEVDDLRYSALVLDVWNIKFRPLTGRDTTRRPNIQNNGDDKRKDEYLTEATLEFWNPESCMFIKNIRSYSES